ncbi:gamma-glutamyl hydrolase A-like isoform X2 [Physella acuta]|nr:gamma-glutamyl hydrolase A-like isoform X2 [Physella acuta]XP_059139704.1 gamma-glutamyl hydrolase A-like isoform X2 [Physella acuta]
MLSLSSFPTILLLIFSILDGAFTLKENNRPIIGILTEPTDTFEFGQEYIQTSYVGYLEMAGARVVPVRGKQPQEYYQQLFKNINGVFFPGGGADIDNGPYAQSGRYFYDMAIEANDKGDYFPIWGTCLGLELLTVLTANKNYLQHTDSENLTLPLIFQKDFKNSRLFTNMPDELIKILASQSITQNNHQFSLLLADYFKLSELHNFYRLMSTSIGRDKQEFVSTFEAYKYPFYGVQWHPEKNIFIWANNQVIDHSFDAVKITQYFADFFVNEARKSSHVYDSSDAEAHAVIENGMRVFVPNFNTAEVFYFNYTNNYFVEKYGRHKSY